MGCMGPFDARFEAYESSRRALSDYAIKNVQKRNFSKMACSAFLLQNNGKKRQKTKKNIKQNKEQIKDKSKKRKMLK